MDKERPLYLAYLLRLWAASKEEGAGWRISKEELSWPKQGLVVVNF